MSLSDGEHVQVLFDEMPDGSNERAYYLGQLVDPQNSSLQHATFIALLAPFLEFLLGDGAHIQLLFDAMSGDDGADERARFLTQLAEDQNASLQTAIVPILVENQPSAVADALLQAPGGAQTVMEQILDGESDLPLQTFLTGLSTDLYTNPQRLNRFVDQLMLDEFEPLRTALVNALQS